MGCLSKTLQLLKLLKEQARIVYSVKCVIIVFLTCWARLDLLISQPPQVVVQANTNCFFRSRTRGAFHIGWC